MTRSLTKTMDTGPIWLLLVRPTLIGLPDGAVEPPRLQRTVCRPFGLQEPQRSYRFTKCDDAEILTIGGLKHGINA